MHDADDAALQVLFVVSHPDVFKSPNSDTYVVFGEVRWNQSLLSLLADSAITSSRSFSGLAAAASLAER